MIYYENIINAELLNRETWVGAMFPLNNPKGKRKRKNKNGTLGGTYGRIAH